MIIMIMKIIKMMIMIIKLLMNQNLVPLDILKKKLEIIQISKIMELKKFNN